MKQNAVLRHWSVSGRVQGVGFRWFVAREARALGLAGWVRNLESGEVQVVATGPATQVERLRAALLRGPANARVDAVDEGVGDGAAPPEMPFSILG
jgi:acylphosphatase